MPRTVTKIWHSILVFLHLSPLSLAEKCRLTFGGAVVLVLIIALLIPYIWMGQLTKNAFLNAGRARSDYLLKHHFKLDSARLSTLPPLESSGAPVDPNTNDILWVHLKDLEPVEIKTMLSKPQRGLLKDLMKQEQEDGVIFVQQNNVTYYDYIRMFRAQESCLSCHNPQGPAYPFSKNEIIGAAVISRPATGLSVIRVGNWTWTIAAGLIGLVGAVIAFYWITQRVILRPIRQLRGMVNNVAEGNLDIRSSINTRDE